jgi:phosphohistidine phosphatase
MRARSLACLVLLPHAESAAAGADGERGLTPRGQEQASRIGAVLRSCQLLPDVVVSSPAPRALRTAKAAVQATRFRVPIQQDPALYDGSLHDVLDCIERHALGPTVWVVGHNPGLQEAGILLGDLWGDWRLNGASAAVFHVEQRPLGLGTARLHQVLGLNKGA